MNTASQEDLRQPWHKPEVMEVEMEETLAGSNQGNVFPNYPVGS